MPFAKQIVKLLLLVICCELILIVAIYSPLYAKEIVRQKSKAVTGRDSSRVKNAKVVTGRAYYYAKRYNGRRTSSGAIANPKLLTAAHPAIPFGKKIKVKNLANNQSVVVTVNDRCPKREFEYIDLSREAAHRLGFLGKGVARVKWIEVAKK